jgi:malate dehydrogenase (oxaloacetate-decarboxylating)(NADP+)
MTALSQDPKASLRTAALDFDQFPKPGKLEITPSKPLANARDLAD